MDSLNVYLPQEKMSSHYLLIHWGGCEIGLGHDQKYFSKYMNNEELAGVCSVIHLLGQHNSSCMIVKNKKTGRVIDPQRILRGYHLRTDRYIPKTKAIPIYQILNGIREREYENYCILINMDCLCTYQFKNRDFLHGIEIACGILSRSSKALIYNTNIDTVRYKSIDDNRLIRSDGIMADQLSERKNSAV